MNYINTDYGIKKIKIQNRSQCHNSKLVSDFNLTPIIAKAFYQQFSLYFEQHAIIRRSGGQISPAKLLPPMNPQANFCPHPAISMTDPALLHTNGKLLLFTWKEQKI